MRGAWFIVLVYNLSELFCSILYLNKMADEINHWNGLRIWHGLYACSVSTKLFNNYKFYFSLTFLKSRVFETKWQMSLIFEMDWDFGQGRSLPILLGGEAWSSAPFCIILTPSYINSALIQVPSYFGAL